MDLQICIDKLICSDTTTNEEVVPFVCSSCWSHILVVTFIYLQTEVIDGLPLGLLKAELNSKEITLYHASHLAHLSLIENSIIGDLDLPTLAHELRFSDGRFYRPINLSTKETYSPDLYEPSMGIPREFL